MATVVLWSRSDEPTCRLVKQYDIAFVSTGDVLRKEIMAKSEVGRKAEEVVAKGGERLRHLSCPAEDDADTHTHGRPRVGRAHA
jgi:hypothetical protein